MCLGGGSPHMPVIPPPPAPQAPPESGAGALSPLQLASGLDQNNSGGKVSSTFGRNALKIALNVPTATGLQIPLPTAGG